MLGVLKVGGAFVFRHMFWLPIVETTKIPEFHDNCESELAVSYFLSSLIVQSMILKCEICGKHWNSSLNSSLFTWQKGSDLSSFICLYDIMFMVETRIEQEKF